jgi:hypothetical protein
MTNFQLVDLRPTAPGMLANHVLLATTSSKSVLRMAADEVTCGNSGVAYFPAYEIVTGPQAPDRFFEPDRRSISKEAVDLVMYALLRACDIVTENPLVEGPRAESAVLRESEIAVATSASEADLASAISARIATIECEEASARL